MMLQNNQDNLGKMLADSMVELPVHLQQRLERIPATRPRLNLAAVMMVLFLTPLFIWLIVQLSPAFQSLLTTVIRNPFSFTFTALFTGSFCAWLPAVALVTLILFVVIAMREELTWQ
ncbi:MAG: hypothetical protein K8R46_13240 [Pirellulales bacterium]|nr:hypothetical protein [Pirellulales bacterium]